MFHLPPFPAHDELRRQILELGRVKPWSKIMSVIAVTGASGFVGGALVRKLAADPGLQCRALVRTSRETGLPAKVDARVWDMLGPSTELARDLVGVNTLVHAAARVHVMRDYSTDPTAAFRRANVEPTAKLATLAARAGVGRFIFVSSIKVNGESTQPGRPFAATDEPKPEDAYAVSKFEAEVALKEVARSTGMDLVIIRPPLIYGPNVGANFRKMMQWVASGVPLPLGSIDNRRSLLALGNLLDLIVLCLEHPAAGNLTFLAADVEVLSTTQLLKRIAHAMGRPARLIRVPRSLVEASAALLGKGDLARRLCQSLEIDPRATQETLHWSPAISAHEALGETVKSFIKG